MTAKRILLVASILIVAGCGQQAPLVPAPGRPMPVRPLMARATPTFDELLTPPTQARPTRIDELVTRSKPRPADPFDLPPPTGGAAPQGPAATDPATATGNPSSVPSGE